jgi:hypothetical protein
LPPPPPGESPLDQCFSPGPGDYVNPSYRPGSCRHEVIDRNVNYVQGNMNALNAAAPTFFKVADNNLQVTTIDFSTIIADLDASLTGAGGVVEGLSAPS